METEAMPVNNLTYSFTLRPKDGLTHSIKSDLLTYMKKQPFSFLVYEKEGMECHAHGQVFYNKETNKNTLDRALDRILKKNKVDYIKKYAICVKPAYNDDFINNYLLNNDDKVNDKSEVAYKNMPSDTSIYYPNKTQQEEYQEKAKLKKLSYNKKITDLVSKYKKSKYSKYERIEAVCFYLHDAAFIENEIHIPKDAKARKNLSTHVYYSLIQKSASYADIIAEWGITHDEEHIPDEHTSKLAMLPYKMDGEYTYDPKKEVTELEQLFKSDTPLYI